RDRSCQCGLQFADVATQAKPLQRACRLNQAEPDQDDAGAPADSDDHAQVDWPGPVARVARRQAPRERGPESGARGGAFVSERLGDLVVAWSELATVVLLGGGLAAHEASPVNNGECGSSERARRNAWSAGPGWPLSASRRKRTSHADQLSGSSLV